MAVRIDVAEIFRHVAPGYRKRCAGHLSAAQLKAMSAIEVCRTPVLGGHMWHCDGCGHDHPLYNSCHNRHCPTCQGLAALKWSETREHDILPVPYFHIVFTLPREIAQIAFANRKVVFDILFRTTASTLRTIAADPRRGGLHTGGTAVLHTWNQQMLFHPHLHVVLPNAGFDVTTGEWRTGSATFFAPVKVVVFQDLPSCDFDIVSTWSFSVLACCSGFSDCTDLPLSDVGIFLSRWLQGALPPVRDGVLST